MSTDQLCFPPHEGLPGVGLPPTIDGFVEPDIGVASDKASDETGWVRSTRITYAGDNGIPLMEFQGLKNNSQDLLYLSFIVRFDQEFDDQDTIILVLHPNYATGHVSKTGEERRLHISPVAQSTGAGIPGTADDIATDHIRTNRDPQSHTFYKWDTGTSTWQQIANPINNVNIKVRSWDLGTNDRNWSVEIQLPTKQTGPNGGGVDWIDLTANPSFGIYFNVLQVCPTCMTGIDPVEGSYSTQFTWPRADFSVMPPTGIIQDPTGMAPPTSLAGFDIPSAWLGEAFLGTSASCHGVRFVGGPLGIGVRDPANPAGPLSSAIDRIPTTANPSGINTFVAQLQNDGTTDAQDVRATFRIADWGIGAVASGSWDLVPTDLNPPDPNNTNPAPIPPGVTVPAAGTSEITMKWLLTAAQQTLYLPPHSHQCIWVLLESDKDVNFTDSSVRRNMDFVSTSTFERAATVSGVGYGSPLDGSSNHDFLLVVSKRQIVSPQYKEANIRGALPSGAPILQAAVGRPRPEEQIPLPPLITQVFQRWATVGTTVSQSNLIWAMNGYRRTGYTITLGVRKYGIYDPVGNFGYVAVHNGEILGFDDSVDGAELIPVAQDVYRLFVPVDGKVVIQTSITSIDRSLQGCLLLLILLLRRLYNFIVGLIRGLFRRS